MTPLSTIYRAAIKASVKNLTNAPHVAEHIPDHKGDGFHAVVKHGNITSTTLMKKFPTVEAAVEHAQHFADALNETPHVDDDPAPRIVAMAAEVQACIDFHLHHIKPKENSNV